MHELATGIGWELVGERATTMGENATAVAVQRDLGVEVIPGSAESGVPCSWSEGGRIGSESEWSGDEGVENGGRTAGRGDERGEDGSEREGATLCSAAPCSACVPWSA